MQRLLIDFSEAEKMPSLIRAITKIKWFLRHIPSDSGLDIVKRRQHKQSKSYGIVQLHGNKFTYVMKVRLHSTEDIVPHLLHL